MAAIATTTFLLGAAFILSSPSAPYLVHELAFGSLIALLAGMWAALYRRRISGE